MKADFSKNKRLRIAICGTRGIPACYGGFETFAEELGTRMVMRGHEVLVYGRRHVISWSEPSYRGVEIRLLWAPQHKYFETPIHSLLSFFDVLRRSADVILVCNAANSPFLPLLKLKGLPVAVNLDGIERLRAKWNVLGRSWYRLGERCSVLFADRLVSDADIIQEYYQKTYKARSVVIRYGARAMGSDLAQAKCNNPFFRAEIADFPDDLGIEPGQYLLYVSRLEPENNAHLVVAAYNSLPKELKRLPLIIVGDAPYADKYKGELRSIAGENIRFAGFRFGAQYEALQSGAFCYLQATEVGGTHPALVEAIGFANCVIANDTPEHREVIGNDAGLIYKKNNVEDLRRCLVQVLEDPEAVVHYRRAAYERARKEFDWEEITNSYEELFYSMVNR